MSLAVAKSHILRAEQELHVRQLPLRRLFNRWQLEAGGKVRFDPAALDFKQDSEACIRVPWPGKFCAGHAHCAGLDKAGCKAQRREAKQAIQTQKTELKGKIRQIQDLQQQQASLPSSTSAESQRLQKSITQLKAEAKRLHGTVSDVLSQQCAWTSNTPAGQYLSSSLPRAQPFEPCARKVPERPYLRYNNARYCCEKEPPTQAEMKAYIDEVLRPAVDKVDKGDSYQTFIQYYADMLVLPAADS